MPAAHRGLPHTLCYSYMPCLPRTRELTRVVPRPKMAKKKVDDKPPAPPPARRRRGLAGKFDLLVAWVMRVARGKDLTTKDKARAPPSESAPPS
jgi:hypothetical protein